MSSKELVDRLATSLSSLPFVEPITADFSVTGVKVICRVKKGTEAAWAKVVEKILRSADRAEFKAHICRLYFLHNGNMVYGWHLGITSSSMEDTIDHVVGLIRGGKAPPARKVSKPQPHVTSMTGYSPPLDADSKGNPIVSKQVMSMPFTGMEGRVDRNMPSKPNDDGRGGGRGVTKIS